MCGALPVGYNFVAWEWEQQINILKTGSKLVKKWRRYKCLKIAQNVCLNVWQCGRSYRIWLIDE